MDADAKGVTRVREQRNFIFSCLQFTYTQDPDSKEIEVGDRPVGGFMYFDVPFSICDDGRARPCGDITGPINDRDEQTILCVTLTDKDGAYTADAKYSYAEPHKVRVRADCGSFAVPIVKVVSGVDL